MAYRPKWRSLGNVLWWAQEELLRFAGRLSRAQIDHVASNLWRGGYTAGWRDKAREVRERLGLDDELAEAAGDRAMAELLAHVRIADPTVYNSAVAVPPIPVRIPARKARVRKP